MMFFFWLSVISVFLVISIDVIAIVLLSTEKRVDEQLQREPFVSVLIAARNEEQNLAACLHSLTRLNYPSEKLEILIGNDHSTDDTLKIARDFADSHPNIKVYTINENLGKAKGKANVLAHLAHLTDKRSEFFLITDADVEVNPEWIRGLVNSWEEGVGIVNGTTLISNSSLIHRLQRYDWLMALGLAKTYSLLPFIGEVITAIGNNMLISRKAYEATGGYENIPFSITEDYQLTIEVKKMGYSCKHLVNNESKAFTKPIKGVVSLLNQRKRWMSGAMRLPVLMVAILFMQALFFPTIILVLLENLAFGGFFLIMKLVLQSLFVAVMTKRLHEKPKLGALLLYEIYSFTLSLLLVIYYFLPIEIDWKGRKYKSNMYEVS